jgi:hypothetical protein
MIYFNILKLGYFFYFSMDSRTQQSSAKRTLGYISRYGIATRKIVY